MKVLSFAIVLVFNACLVLAQKRSSDFLITSNTSLPEGVEVVACVREPERTVAFYQDLGLEAIVDYDRGTPIGGWVVVGDRTFYLASLGYGPCKSEWTSGNPERSRSSEIGRFQLFLRVRNLDYSFGRARECGIETYHDIGQPGLGVGMARFAVIDPDGNYVTLIRAGGATEFGVLTLSAPDTVTRTAVLVANSHEPFWRGEWEGTNQLDVKDGRFQKRIPVGTYRLLLLDQSGAVAKEIPIVIRQEQITRIQIP